MNVLKIPPPPPDNPSNSQTLNFDIFWNDFSFPDHYHLCIYITVLIIRAPVSMGAMGASVPTVFDKFLTFASIFIEMMRKVLQK